MKRINVLIDNVLTTSGLAVARALKKHNCYTIHAVAVSSGHFYDKIFNLFKSKAINSLSFTKGDYSDDSRIEELTELIKKLQIDVLIPVGTASTLAVSKAKKTLSEFCKVPVDEYQKMERFHDKSKTMRLASELGIPHPKTFFPSDLAETKEYAANIKYPVVLKARKGFATNGVWYANNQEELLNLYNKVIKEKNNGDCFINNKSNPMIQEYIPGELHDVTAFCIKGKMKIGLSQQRIMTKPLTGGGGIINITTQNEKLLNYARKIVSHTKWDGVALFDFKIDERDANPKLLEVNPKFWGTTWLTICAGLNYPHYLIQYAMGEKPEIPSEYKVGLICRWPMAELATIMEKPVTLGTALKRLGGFFKRFNQQNTVSDILLSDIKPSLVSPLIFWSVFKKRVSL
jgi:predicted ATP-grasp superfamily ATP-dependent carboligase